MSKLRIERFRNDVVICRPPFATSRTIPNRSECGAWSERSRRRLAFVASNTGVQFRAMITLTYGADFPCTGSMVKSHLNSFLVALRWRLRPSNCLSYLWWLEFQKRGAPHVHILVNRPCRDLPEKRWFSLAWYRIVGSEDPKHLAAGTRVEDLRSPRAGAHYAVKYSQKMTQKTVPAGFRDVGRFWAHSRDVAPSVLQVFYVNSTEELAELLTGWEHVDIISNPYVTTLYNAAPYLLGQEGLVNDRFAQADAELCGRLNPWWERKNRSDRPRGLPAAELVSAGAPASIPR